MLEGLGDVGKKGVEGMTLARIDGDLDDGEGGTPAHLW
jgi:hypothetical protein